MTTHDRETNVLVVIPHDHENDADSAIPDTGRHLCSVLGKMPGQNVDMLWASPVSTNRMREMRQVLNGIARTVYRLADLQHIEAPISGTTETVHDSIRIFEFLKNNRFDVVYFFDHLANGLASVQAKQSGVALWNTTIITLRSDGNGELFSAFGKKAIDRVMTEWAEQYVRKHSDQLVVISASDVSESPTTESHHPDTNLFINPPYSRQLQPAGRVSIDTLDVIVIGDGGSTSRFDLLLASLDEALGSSGRAIRTIGFYFEARTEDDLSYLDKTWRLSERHIEVETRILSLEQVHSAIATGGDPSTVFLLASSAGKSLYTVLRLVDVDSRFACFANGQIDHFVSPDCLLPMASSAIADRIRQLLEQPWSPRHLYTSEEANRGWYAFHDSASHAARTVCQPSIPTTPVCVCIAHYNQGSYLPRALRALADSDHPVSEVVVVDDGSSEPDSIAVFKRMSEKYPHWTFLRTENQGPSRARNVAARHTDAPWLVFLDADNEATSALTGTFLRAAEYSGADCVTCLFKAFDDTISPGEDAVPLYQSSLLGAACLPGLVENVFGDTTSIVKRSVFEALGGFGSNDCAEHYEDWSFHARLCLRGFRLQVIPEPLLWYRHADESRSRSQDRGQQLRTRQGIVDLYAREQFDFSNAARELLVPLYFESLVRSAIDDSDTRDPFAHSIAECANVLEADESVLRAIRRIDQLLGRNENVPEGWTIDEPSLGDSQSDKELNPRSLLELDNRSFLAKAYRTVLLRAPDPSGFAHYLEVLDKGLSTKHEILMQIRNSPEGRLKGVRITTLESDS